MCLLKNIEKNPIHLFPSSSRSPFSSFLTPPSPHLLRTCVLSSQLCARGRRHLSPRPQACLSVSPLLALSTVLRPSHLLLSISRASSVRSLILHHWRMEQTLWRVGEGGSVNWEERPPSLLARGWARVTSAVHVTRNVLWCLLCSRRPLTISISPMAFPHQHGIQNRRSRGLKEMAGRSQ